jgi:hypothetical protein
MLARLKNPQTLFYLLVAAYVIYAGAFIFLTSVIVYPNEANKGYIHETKRYYVLFDDAMISMAYAKNLANGDGLVWRPGGPRVEGYTNPAWTIYMAFWHWIDIADESKISAIIQISGALCLIANLFVIKRIADRVSNRDPIVTLGAVFFTAFYLPLNMWSLQGTEVSILTLIVSLATLWALRVMETGRFSLAPYLLLGFSALIRMDMAVPMGALALFMIFNDRANWRNHLILPPLILAGFMAPLFACRKWYYDDWLPNTYYLKLDGYPFVMRLTQGYEVTGRFFAKVGALPFAIFIFRRDRRIRLVAWMFVAQVLYNIYVGGDAWEWYGGANRYIAIAIPMFFIMLWCVLATIYRWLVEAARALGDSDPRFRLKPTAAGVGLGFAAVILLVTYNYTYGTDALKEWLLLHPSMFADENRNKVEDAKLLEALTTPQATITIAAAGIVPYFADRTFIDLLGKNDTVIGRSQMKGDQVPEFLPGHMKWDYGYSIGQLKPDVVFELWLHAQDAGQYLSADYLAIWFPPAARDAWFRKESPNIYWDRIWGG